MRNISVSGLETGGTGILPVIDRRDACPTKSRYPEVLNGFTQHPMLVEGNLAALHPFEHLTKTTSEVIMFPISAGFAGRID